MKKNAIQSIVLAAILSALALILTRFLSLKIDLFGFTAIRMDTGFAAIIFAGSILGPFYGAAVGILSDLLGATLLPIGPYFPGFTLTNALVGFLPGILIYLYINKNRNALLKQEKIISKLSLIYVGTTAIACFTASLLNTLWLKILYNKAYLVLMYPRLVAALVMFPLISAIVIILSKVYYKFSH